MNRTRQRTPILHFIAAAQSLPTAFVCVPAMFVFCAVATIPLAHAEDSQDALRFDLKVGVESDNNALREEGTERKADHLTRYFFKMESNHAWGTAQRLGVRLRSGGKLFATFEQENTLINQIDARYTIFPSRSLSLEQDPDSNFAWFFFAAGGLKDRTEDTSRRDYIRGSAEGGTGCFWEGVTWTVSAGVVSFAFKPNPDLSSTGPIINTQLSAVFAEAWTLRMFGSRLERSYDSAPIRVVDGTLIAPPLGLSRSDNVLSGGLGGGYRGEVFLGEVDLNAQSNTSNSYGQSFVRYGFAINSTLSLPWEVLVHGRASLQRTAYDDELFLDDTIIVDEDNRNTYVVSIERPLWWDNWRIEARYALYTQEFGLADADYTRQLVFVGLGVGN